KIGPIDRLVQHVRKNVRAPEFRRKRTALVNDSAAGNMPSAIAGVRHMVEVAVSVGVVQRAMFAKVLYVIRALDLVQHFLIEIRSGQDLAALVEIEAPGIAPTFGKQLELFGERMVPPNALLKFEVPNVGRDRAALRAVKPAVWPPSERI